MDREDQRRYFVVGSVFIEIVTPLFRQKIVNDYTTKGFRSIQAFINSQSVIHILFHLRHRNTHCCQDQVHCFNSPALPVNYRQWDLLYTENPGPGPHNCHCKFTANQIQLDDLDITLASLILLNCCNLGLQDENVVKKLRNYKNDYLSHNTSGQIKETKYNTILTDLKSFILQLDPSKEDDLVRIEQRPLDQPLCGKYLTCLLDLHQKLDEMDTKLELIQDILRNQPRKNKSISLCCLSSQSKLVKIKHKLSDKPAQPKLGESDKPAQPKLGLSDKPAQPKLGLVHEPAQPMLGLSDKQAQPKLGLSDKQAQPKLGLVHEPAQPMLGLSDKLAQLKLGESDKPAQPMLGLSDKPEQPLLGQTLFTLQKQTNLSLVVDGYWRAVTDILMMDDGRLVMCLPDQNRLLICNTDGSQVDSIDVQGGPWYITAVNSSTVAVTLEWSNCIEMYDIHNKLKLKSISLPGMNCCRSGITTIHNKLVVGCNNILLIIDHQAGKVVKTIQIHCDPWKLHGSGDRIFYFNNNTDKTLYRYSYIDDRQNTLILPSIPRSMTTLQDGSLYLVCKDGSVQHVSSDGQKYRPVKTLQSISHCDGIHYNLTQRKLVTIDRKNTHVTSKVFNEINKFGVLTVF